MPEKRPERDGIGDEPAPETARAALERAHRHGRTAMSELLSALHALLDAANIAARGESAEHSRVLGSMASLLDGLAEQLADPAGAPAPLLSAIADSLDAEIARWESRAQDDAEARAVLRAFLGLRELLWEFGIRPSGGGSAPGDPARKPARARRAATQRRGSGRPRVQRVPIQS